MKVHWALVCSSACVTGTVAVAQTSISELESRVLSGGLSPQAAIIEYCKGETLDKTQDAFCSCPEEALRLLEQRMKLPPMDAS